MTVYEVLNKAIEKEVIDFNKYELMFALQSQEVFDVKDAESAKVANQEVRKNYVCIRDIETKDSVIQLWGWVRKGVVVVEVRKRLAKTLDINSLKSFTACELDKNKNFICTDVQQALTLVKVVFNRLSKNSTNASEKAEQSEKVG